ncbi:hypothetical protein CHS0354_025993 [Potamilus streckersoni]|uniref:Uncharacterized protein n=1 Tax=Potamilus streckersoni TaxID=2493646 RepID=A0AAE0T434_9BIVA|nr:hypothetical protein CHS0354_025993 [Potamilus streckersoni]
MDEITWFKLNELQRRLNIREIPRVVLLIKIDFLSETLAKDLKEVFKCAEVKEAVYYVSQKLHVDPGDVMPIKNYESESMVNNTIGSLAMQALDRMLGYASDYLENKHHPKQDAAT